MMFAYAPRVGAGRLVGRVASWKQGGYGFIRVERIGYFCHVTDIEEGGPLTPGEFVAFTPAMGPRGPRAANVRRLPTQCLKCEANLQGPTCTACGFTLDAGTA